MCEVIRTYNPSDSVKEKQTELQAAKERITPKLNVFKNKQSEAYTAKRNELVASRTNDKKYWSCFKKREE